MNALVAMAGASCLPVGQPGGRAPDRAVQLHFDAIERQLPIGRPLAPLKAVMFVLDRDEDNVKFLYESGYLEFAFNLGDAKARRADVRVYRESVIRYMKGDLSHLRNAQCELETVVSACLPANRGPILLSQLTRLWTVSSTHLHDLVTVGDLKVVPGQTLKTKQSPLLVRASVTEFLQRRRIT